MTLNVILILIAMSLGAAFVQRVSGFGFGIFIMTVLPYLLPTYGEATTLSGLMALVTSAIIVAQNWRHIAWRKLLPILGTFLVVSFFAIQFVAWAGDGTLKRILGGVLILAALYFYFVAPKLQLRATLPMQIGLGSLSGVMGGLFGMQGPPAVLYFLGSAASKEQYMALCQCYFLIGNGVMTLFRAGNGFLTPMVMEAWCWGAPAVLLGTWIGTKIYRRMPIDTLRKIIYIYMAISGLIALCA